MLSELIQEFESLSLDDRLIEINSLSSERSQEYIQHLVNLVLEEQAQEKMPIEPTLLLAEQGIAVCGLYILESRRNLAGLHNLVMGLQETMLGREVPIPEHKIGKGSVVSLSRYDPYDNKIHEGFQAVVSQVKKSSIHLLLYHDFDRLPNALLGECQIVRLPCKVPYNRMLEALYHLSLQNKTFRCGRLASILLERANPSLPGILIQKLVLLDQNLNEYQEEAASFAINSPEIALIHGPPGTGKTQTLVEVIRQLQQQGKKILVTGPSNVSVDNLMERIVDHIPGGIVRIGGLARVSPKCINYCADRLNSVPALKKAFIAKAGVIFSTLCGAGHADLKSLEFDVVVIDEASQATEPDCWIPLVKAKKVILAGDHLQLPPTVLSTIDNAKVEKGLSTSNTLSYSLFDRLLDTHGAKIKRMLEIQYRMNEKIMHYSSKHFYDNKLVAHSSVENHLLSDLEHVSKNDITSKAIVLYDTSFLIGIQEQKRKKFDDDSLYNPAEVSIVVEIVQQLMESGVKKAEIGVITPYSAQVNHLQNGLGDALEEIEIGTVDGFQGKEKEVIILSMVRSNDHGLVGFLGEKRRLNVAITRARRQLVIVGNSKTLKGIGVKSSRDNGFLGDWIKWLTEGSNSNCEIVPVKSLNHNTAYEVPVVIQPPTVKKSKKKNSKKNSLKIQVI